MPKADDSCCCRAQKRKASQAAESGGGNRIRIAAGKKQKPGTSAKGGDAPRGVAKDAPVGSKAPRSAPTTPAKGEQQAKQKSRKASKPAEETNKDLAGAPLKPSELAETAEHWLIKVMPLQHHPVILPCCRYGWAPISKSSRAARWTPVTAQGCLPNLGV